MCNMARILFISPFYPPERAAAAVCVSEYAQRLASWRHQVTVLTTFPNYPTGVVPPEYRRRVVQIERLNGVRVVRVWSYTSPTKNFLRRIVAQVSFGFLAPVLSWRAVGHPDIIIAQSPPLFDAIAVRILAWRKRCPFIFMVSDLWPESAIQFGALHNCWAIRLAEWLEWSTYESAKLVWVVTEGIRDRLLQRGLPSERIFLLTNGVDTSRFRPSSKALARAGLGWDTRFVVLYAGTHGLAHGLMAILEAASQLRELPIHFIFVGDGVEKAHLVAHAQKQQLEQVTFLDSVPHEQVPMLLSAADVCLVPLRKLPLLTGTLPVKMFEIMSCASPMVVLAEGEACRIAAQEAGAAIAVEPENADELAAAILYLHEHPDYAELLGSNGRAYVEAHYDYDLLAAALDTCIAPILGKQALAPQMRQIVQNEHEQSEVLTKRR